MSRLAVVKTSDDFEVLASTTPRYELRVCLHSTHDMEVAVWQVPARATPYIKAPLRYETLVNDLNPVAGLILKVTVGWPARLGLDVYEEFQCISARWREKVAHELVGLFRQDGAPDKIDTTYIWARTITSAPTATA